MPREGEERTPSSVVKSDIDMRHKLHRVEQEKAEKGFGLFIDR